MNRVVTLTTDLGSSDAYVAAMKGVILTINAEASIIDITHSIEPQNILQGAFILNTAYRYFPKQTIHMAIVDPDVGSERQAIILKTSLALFVAPDNGILSYVINELSPTRNPSSQYNSNLEELNLKKGLEAVAITDPRFWRHPVSPTFHGRDIFAPVAAGLSLDISPYEFGEKITSLHVFPIPKPFSDPQGNLIGHILHVDHFGNLITDIKNSDLPSRREELIIEIAGYRIHGVSSYYAQEERLMALLGSSGCLEISLRNENASDFLDTRIGDEIRVISSPLKAM
ncbi:MAG: SAM-dependent chlorinase/fluorinase [Dehalococcoidia bacterium]|nr:SAM-dependent chlorinase/fluorinase [Dehalococcoidia bacterium]